MLDICNRFAPPADAEPLTRPRRRDRTRRRAAAGTAGGAPAQGGIAGREQALRQLGEIAAWFKRTEPHSPLAYTLEEAVRRGRMGWPDLIEELLPDESTRHALLTSLGIKPWEPKE